MYLQFTQRLRRPISLLALFGSLITAGCQSSLPARAVGRGVVSLDYCADQFVLGLADRENILAVSPNARSSFSYMRAAAHGLPVVRPRAEDVLALKPDLVVRSYGGGVNAQAFFQRAGVPVLQIRSANNLDGVRAMIRHAARGLGVPQRGELLITKMNQRLQAAQAYPPHTHALYVTPAGYTTGPGTLVHSLFTAAGLDNFETRAGWHPIPLERLAYEIPDMIALATFGVSANHDDAWTAFRHPVAHRTMSTVPTMPLDGATTSCGGWFVADAVVGLRALHRKLLAESEPSTDSELGANRELPAKGFSRD